MIGENLRKWGFWTLDFLRGGQVRKHYNDIKKIIEDCEESNTIVDKYTNNILKYAVESTDFYKGYDNFSSIKDFPIIDKNTFRANEKSLLSKEYIGKELHTMSTSGSTGTPFTVRQDRNKRNRVLAEIIYFGEICGYYLGDRNVYLRIWTEKNKKSNLAAFKQNLVMLDISNLDEENLEDIRKTLKSDKKVKCILGYATGLDIVSKYLLGKGDNSSMFNINIIISGSEILKETARANLEKVFGCPVVSRYSNQENGILTQELVGKDYSIINNASYNIEFLKLDSNEEAEYGELARVIVTDLFNHATPMIRYDTGDLAMVEENEKHGKVITSIEGKRRDFIYDIDDELLSPGIVAVNMWGFDKIKQYQLIQEDKGRYTLKLNGAKGIYDEEEIINLFKSFLGEEAKIDISHVDGIPLLKSGKFQTTVCKYNPEEKQKNV